MTLLTPEITSAQYLTILKDPNQSAFVPHDDCMGWSADCKALYLKNMTDVLYQKGVNVHLTDRYYPNGADKTRKEWELENDDAGEVFRPVPVGELDTDNNIYLNIKEIGYISSFFTLMHLYGHRVQIETMEKHPKTPLGKYYANITKYVAWEKPLNMDDVYQDYQSNPGKLNANYENDFLDFEREAFAFGYGLMEEADVPITADLQYAVNTYIVTDFEEIKSWWQNSPVKNGDNFNERYNDLYNRYRQNGQILIDYEPVQAKPSPYAFFQRSTNGVVVVRNDTDLK